MNGSPGVQGEKARYNVDTVSRDERDDHLQEDRAAKVPDSLNRAQDRACQHTDCQPLSRLSIHCEYLTKYSLSSQKSEEVDGPFVLPR